MMENNYVKATGMLGNLTTTGVVGGKYSVFYGDYNILLMALVMEVASEMTAVGTLYTRVVNLKSREPLTDSQVGMPGLSGMAAILAIVSVLAGHWGHILSQPMTVMLTQTVGIALGYLLLLQETQTLVLEFLNLGQGCASKAVASKIAPILETRSWGPVSFVVLLVTMFLCTVRLNYIVTVGALLGGFAAGRIFPRVAAFKHGATPLMFLAMSILEWPTVLYFSKLIAMQSGVATTGRNAEIGVNRSRRENFWHLYKRLTNKMNKQEFDNYKKVQTLEVKKQKGVFSKGYYKLDYLLTALKRALRTVLELGGGAGGMMQNLIGRRPVKHVTTLNLDREGYGQHRIAQERPPGYGKNKVLYGDVHDFNLEEEYDMILSDIGESKMTVEEQFKYPRKKRDNMRRLLAKHHGLVVYKELCPWDEDLKSFMEEHGLKGVWLPYSRNSSTEFYLTNFGAGMNWAEMQDYASVLLSRMGKLGSVVKVTVPVGDVTRRLSHQEQPPPDRLSRLEAPDYSLTMANLADRYKLKEPRNTYHSVREVGRVEGIGDTRSGVVKNTIMWMFLQGLDGIRKFTSLWGLTDTSAQATFEVYMKKVDTVTPAVITYDKLEEKVWDVLAQKVVKKKFGRLSYAEGVARLRSKSAGGLAFKEWLDDGEMEKTVMEEIERIKEGRPTMGWVNTMGKREKKKNPRKGSRLISYYDIPVRIIEQMVFGELMDYLSRRTTLPTAVGHMNPMDYFQLMAQEELDSGRGVEDGSSRFIANDIAGWDTRVRRKDLEEEHRFRSGFIAEKDQELTNGLYRMFDCHITLLKRPGEKGVELSIVQEEKGRLSGFVGTYTMNTVTNTVKTITHIASTFGEEPSKVWEMLQTGRLNCYISGDDKVIAGGESDIEKLANSVAYWTASGYARKDKDPMEKSEVLSDFEELEFCSHKPISIGFTTQKGKFEKYLPTRGQDEIFAKLVYSVGAFYDEETQAAHALSLRNYLLQFVFKRDVRLLVKKLTEALPVNMVPMGKMQRPRQLATPWMDEKDLNRCATKIFSTLATFDVELGDKSI